MIAARDAGGVRDKDDSLKAELAPPREKLGDSAPTQSERNAPRRIKPC